jgi:hypothetical protein
MLGALWPSRSRREPVFQQADNLRQSLPGDLLEALDKSDASFTRRLGRALSKRSGTRHGERQLYIETVGEYNRAKVWGVSEGSGAYEFMSVMSFYNPKQDFNNDSNGGHGEETPRGGVEKTLETLKP